MDRLTNYSDTSGIPFFSCLTIDVEDGINISMRDNFNIQMKPTNRVIDNVEIILEICEKNNVKATFFILGEVAESFPDLIKRIHSLGHEIGIHGFHHDQIFKLTQTTLRNELIRAKGLVETLIGQKTMGFRAPAFSINAQTSWALKVISECGFEYDSSIFPSVSRRYGWGGFSKQICRLEFDNNTTLIEVPLSTINLFGKDLPVCGGGYLRYFPYAFTRKAIQTINKVRPPIIYLHPYELDIEKYPDYFHEAIEKAQLKQRFHLLFYQHNKHTVRGKLDNLTRMFKFKPLGEIIKNLERAGLIPSRNLFT